MVATKAVGHQIPVELYSLGTCSALSFKFVSLVEVLFLPLCPEGTHLHCLHRERDASRINYMYAQYVKNTMEGLNIPDVTKDKRFPWTVGNPAFGLAVSHQKRTRRDSSREDWPGLGDGGAVVPSDPTKGVK